MSLLCTTFGHSLIPRWDVIRGFYRQCSRCGLIERTKERTNVS